MDNIKPGDHVKFVWETPDESKFTMIVREVNGDRVLIETIVPNLIYNPISTFPISSITKIKDN